MRYGTMFHLNNKGFIYYCIMKNELDKFLFVTIFIVCFIVLIYLGYQIVTKNNL